MLLSWEWLINGDTHIRVITLFWSCGDQMPNFSELGRSESLPGEFMRLHYQTTPIGKGVPNVIISLLFLIF